MAPLFLIIIIMFPLFLVPIILFIGRNNTTSQKISIIFNHILHNSIETTVIAAVLYIDIKIFYHIENIVWSFETKLIYQWNTFAMLFLFFVFLFVFKLSVRTINVRWLFVWIGLDVLDFNTFNLVVGIISVTISNL